MAVMRIYRHAESAKNKNGNIVGGRSIESHLTSDGEHQADELGLALRRKNRRLIAAFASSADRAIQTGVRSLQAGEFDLELHEHEGLLEISQGLWEGKDRRQPLTLPNGTTEVYTHPYSRGLHGRVTGGESVAEAGERMEQVLNKIEGQYSDADGDIAIFSHDVALRCLRVRLNKEHDHIREGVAYCSETTIARQEGRLAIVQFGVPMIDQI